MELRAVGRNARNPRNPRKPSPTSSLCHCVLCLPHMAVSQSIFLSVCWSVRLSFHSVVIMMSGTRCQRYTRQIRLLRVWEPLKYGKMTLT